MATDHRTTGLGQDFAIAIDDLRATLQRATDATAALRDILPRIDAITGIFDDIEAALTAGRERLGGGTPAFSGGRAFGFEAPRPRPTLVMPQQTLEAPAVAVNGTVALGEAHPAGTARTLRIEIESAGAQLDLRAVDDAMSRHPDVSDVALLDYDGRRATLKLWVTSSAADVQRWLESDGALPDGHEFTVVALDDVA